MRILALERNLPARAHPNLPDLVRAEAACIWDLHRRGFIREAWSTVPGQRAILLLECTGAVEAKGHLDALPLVRLGLREFEMLELEAYDGFDLLLGVGQGAPSRAEEPPEY